MKMMTRILPLLLLTMLALPATSFGASSAANTQIINSATLSYAGGSVTASITVTVAMVKSNAQLILVAQAPAPYAGVDTVQNDTVTLTATNNGPDNYTVAVTAPAGTQTNNSGSGSVSIPLPATASVTLGATVTSSGTSDNTLIVPATIFDTAGQIFNSATMVNGIAKDTLITFAGSGSTRTVASVTNPGAGAGNAVITFSGAAVAVAAGTPVYEVKTIPVQVKSGTIQNPLNKIDIVVNATVSNGVDITTPAVTVTNSYDPATIGTAKILKYVRNATTTTFTGTGGTDFTIDGFLYTFYNGNVKANPGDVLEYVVQASNIDPVGGNNLTGAAISDTLPTSWVTYNPNPYAAGTRDVAYFDGTSLTYHSNGAGGSLSRFSGNTLTVNVGDGAASGAGNGGTLPPQKTVWIAYQVKVN